MCAGARSEMDSDGRGRSGTKSMARREGNTAGLSDREAATQNFVRLSLVTTKSRVPGYEDVYAGLIVRVLGGGYFDVVLSDG